MSNPLNAQQIAALTACVPCSGDKALDRIISVSLRLKLATEFMNGMLSNNYNSNRLNTDELAQDALTYADALLAHFNEKK